MPRIIKYGLPWQQHALSRLPWSPPALRYIKLLLWCFLGHICDNCWRIFKFHFPILLYRNVNHYHNVCIAMSCDSWTKQSTRSNQADILLVLLISYYASKTSLVYQLEHLCVLDWTPDHVLTKGWYEMRNILVDSRKFFIKWGCGLVVWHLLSIRCHSDYWVEKVLGSIPSYSIYAYFVHAPSRVIDASASLLMRIDMWIA